MEQLYASGASHELSTKHQQGDLASQPRMQKIPELHFYWAAALWRMQLCHDRRTIGCTEDVRFLQMPIYR